jgi:hypothetical protein
MKKLPFDQYTDDFILDYKNLDEISYNDYGDYYIELYHNNNLVAELEVFTDHENDNREYVCINHEIIYLDTIKKR